jgi:hypothetical protein
MGNCCSLIFTILLKYYYEFKFQQSSKQINESYGFIDSGRGCLQPLIYIVFPKFENCLIVDMLDVPELFLQREILDEFELRDWDHIQDLFQ